MIYQYSVLAPELGESQSPFDLGIEVTDPALAQGRPNLDPQHGISANPNSSAIEEARFYPLPRRGSVIATIRPDSDSVGAMAVLEARAQGKKINSGIIQALGRLDALGPAAWRFPAVRRYEKVLAAVRIACLGLGDIQKKVELMVQVVCGETPPVLESLYRQSQERLAEAGTTLRTEWLVPQRVLLVEGNSPNAFDVGYQMSDVVAALNPSFRRPWLKEDPPHIKWTIARAHQQVPFNVAALTQNLLALEPGWGGTANLVASPQGLSPQLDRDIILKLIRAAIYSSLEGNES